jgi:hypothetical protein
VTTASPSTPRGNRSGTIKLQDQIVKRASLPHRQSHSKITLKRSATVVINLSHGHSGYHRYEVA